MGRNTAADLGGEKIVDVDIPGAFLLTWFNFNPSMDK